MMQANPKIIDPAGPAVRFTGGAALLSDEHRALLWKLISDHPRASLGQLRKMFEVKSGRSIARSSIRIIRNHGLPPSGLSAHCVRLTAVQGELLLEIAKDAAPEYCRAEIAREFEVQTGRPISSHAVSLFIRRKLGVPKLNCGGDMRRYSEGSADRRIAEAHERKLAKAPVDRSVRAGRTGRAFGGMGGEGRDD